ncbi:MAG: prepilin-type N-terminal cleavage/methylation domain-containing protein [Gemmatimonadota bacterium]
MNARPGFTMVEILTVIAVLAILSAVIVTQVVPRVTESKGAAVARTLDAFRDAAIEYRADVRRYPTHLRHLTTAPVTGTRDLCNQTIPAQFLAAWRGPYLKAAVSSAGLPIAEATVRDSLELDPAGPYTSTSTGAMVVVTQNVDSVVAVQLESAFDGNSNLTSGTIRFTPGAARTGTLKFAIPVRGC